MWSIKVHFIFSLIHICSPYGSHNNHLLNVVSSMEVYPLCSHSSRNNNSAMEDHSMESYSSIEVRFNYLDKFQFKSIIYLHRSSNNFIHRSLSIGSHSFHFLELNSYIIMHSIDSHLTLHLLSFHPMGLHPYIKINVKFHWSNSTGPQYVMLQIKIGWRQVKTCQFGSTKWF